MANCQIAGRDRARRARPASAPARPARGSTRRPQQADEQHDAARRRPARRSGESAAQSMCGPLTCGGGEQGASSARHPRLATRGLRAAPARSRDCTVGSRRCSANCGYSASARITSDERHEHERRRRTPISRDSTLAPDAVVHRADEQPQRVDARRSTTPVKATIAMTSLALKTPSRIRNSPTKFDEPGIASVASATIRNERREHRARGTRSRPCRAGPPSRRRARRAAATMKNSGATTRPWLTICSSAPWRALRVQREDPERDEAELRDRRVADDQPRVGRRERHQPSRRGSRPARSAASASGSAPTASGNSGSTIRRKP